MVITGDITQIDLPHNKESGLKIACKALSIIKGIAFIFFSESDVVHHKLVKDIIKTYDDLDSAV